MHRLEERRHAAWVREFGLLAERLAPCGGTFLTYPPGVREALLGQGAWRTIRGHILAWKRFERWCSLQQPSQDPLSRGAILTFAEGEAQRTATAVAVFRGSLRFLSARLSIRLPEADGPALSALAAKARASLAQDSRQARPHPN